MQRLKQYDPYKTKLARARDEAIQKERNRIKAKASQERALWLDALEQRGLEGLTKQESCKLLSWTPSQYDHHLQYTMIGHSELIRYDMQDHKIHWIDGKEPDNKQDWELEL